MNELSRHTTIDSLLDAWRETAKDRIKLFIDDGIICGEEYATPHILFAMRDMNTSDPISLRDDLRTRGSGWKTWNNAARWVHALLTGDEEYPVSIDRRAEMRKAAVINLKKEAGGSRANKKELAEAVKTDASYILREIEICSPDIIICGGFGNAGLLKDHVFCSLAGEWMELPAQHFHHNWSYFLARVNGKTIPVISFCHPQVTVFKGRRGHQDLFEPLYREMLHIRRHFFP